MNSKDDFFATLQKSVTTHLDVRKEGQEVFERVSKNENEWGKLIGTHMERVYKALTKQDEKLVDKSMHEMLDETIKLRNNNVEDVSRMLGEKMAEAYSIGFAEGSYDNMKHTVKMMRDRIKDGSLHEIPDLERLLKIIEDAATEQYDKNFEGKPLTFFAPTSKK